MNQKMLGYVIIIAGLGMMLTLLAGDISNLKSWNEVLYPSFAAGVMTHIGAVLTAAVGGNLVPNIFKKFTDTVSQETLAKLNGEGK